MTEGTSEEWPRKDMGNDREAWSWAMGQFGDHTVVPLATLSDDGPRVRPVTVVTHEGKARPAETTTTITSPKGTHRILRSPWKWGRTSIMP